MTRLRFYIFYLALSSGLAYGQGYQGAIHDTGCGSLRGWAWQQTTAQINVDLYDGGVYVLTSLANQNLGSWSVLNGVNHGFSVSIPSSIKDNQIHRLSVRYNGTLSDLPYGTTTQYYVTVQCTASSTGYQYYNTDTLQTISSANWNQNGIVSGAQYYGLQATSSGGGSLISKVAVQSPNTANYEVNSTLSLKTSGGVYVQYLRASNDALTGQGSYFSVELQNPTFHASTGTCTATLAAYQSGSSTALYSTPVACQDGMEVRTVIVGTSANTMVNGVVYTVNNLTVTSGAPGIGGRSMPSSNAISFVQLGRWDSVPPPNPVNVNSFTSAVYFSGTPGTDGDATCEWQGVPTIPTAWGSPIIRSTEPHHSARTPTHPASSVTTLPSSTTR